MRVEILVVSLCLLLLVPVFETAAAWIDDGNLVDPGDTSWHLSADNIAPDGSGGAIVIWHEEYWGPGDVHYFMCQRIDTDGIVQWSSPASISGYPFEHSGIASDDAGGAFMVRSDSEFMGWYGLGLARIYADGSSSSVVFWQDATYDIMANCHHDIIPDGAGGTILTWSGTFFNDFNGGDIAGVFVVAQRIDSGNNRLWGDSGVYVCMGSEGKAYPRVVSDSGGGVIILWLDYRDDGDIYAQRLDGSGTELWTTDGLPVMTAGVPQSHIRMIPDGSGGAIFAWEDERNGNTDIYAQRIDGSGSVLWAADGMPVCTATGDQVEAYLVSDGAGGAIISWCDPRSGDLDIYAQRIDASGTALWGTGGLAIVSGLGDQRCGRIQEYGSGGAIISYVDDSNGDMNIMTQHIDGDGIMHWGPNGISVCSAAGDQDNIVMTTDGAGGAIIAWDDARSSEWEEIYASRVTYPVTTDDRVEPSAATMLDQNHPNPFNPSTTISFSLSTPSYVSLRIYDASGRYIRTLIDEPYDAGRHEERWDGRDDHGRELSSGLYFCRIEAGALSETRKMVLLR